MNDDWEKAKKIFAAVIKIAPDERRRFLDKNCADDKTLRREVESLLDSFDDAQSFMESPAVSEVAEVFRQNKNLEKGKSFGHYEIIKQIGAGGMGGLSCRRYETKSKVGDLVFEKLRERYCCLRSGKK